MERGITVAKKLAIVVMADADMTATTAEESVGGGITKKGEVGKEE